MNLRCIFFLAALGLGCAAAAAQSQDTSNLPSAPSAVKQQQQAPPPPPAPAAAQPTDSSSSAAQPAASAPPSAKPAETESAKSTGAPAEDKPATSTDSGKPAGTASAGSAVSSDEDTNVATIRRTVNEVNVVFTVTDKHGRYVKDLKEGDFSVLDDKRPPKEIRTFHSETDLPLLVGLLIDASNSVRDRFRFEQEAAIEFLNQITRPGYDKAFVVGFDTTPEVTQDFTDNTELLSRGVHSLRAGGGTAMYDALYFACRDKLLKAARTGPARRAVILLSDGQDNQSRVTREESIEMAQRADVIVYTISTNVSGIKQSGDKVLERIAEATGGRAFFPFQMTDVSNAFAAIQDELRSQYLMAYIPDDFQHDGRYRTIEIVAHQKKQFHVRSRRGYYAPNR
ncbi:MAG TPA: VWA domain-containing protein [Terriglobales bacterium]|nr:VWA domain-containing protein [Terriglobales bacterium]